MPASTMACFYSAPLAWNLTGVDTKPFVWTADPDKIIAAVRRGHQVLDSDH
ncbi:hypothetical protein ACVWYO_002489 [Sphingomonas sp. UYP23]